MGERQRFNQVVPAASLPRARALALRCVSGILISLAAGCGSAPETALQRLVEARRLAAEILVQFSTAADAANRSVMADTDEASVAFAREAGQATQAVQRNTDALRPVLENLGYTRETQLLGEFVSRFSEYRELDRSILELAVENTNIKAQRLSFGGAQEAANALRDALDAIAPSSPDNTWHVKALAATAAAEVREIQVLQAQHIAEADDAAMTRMEKAMATSETTARTALETLSPLVPAASRPRLDAARAALDRFMSVNGEIIALSRRNTNVRSLALSLGKKRALTAMCEESLRALQNALAERGFSATR